MQFTIGLYNDEKTIRYQISAEKHKQKGYFTWTPAIGPRFDLPSQSTFLKLKHPLRMFNVNYIYFY